MNKSEILFHIDDKFYSFENIIRLVIDNQKTIDRLKKKIECLEQRNYLNELFDSK